MPHSLDSLVRSAKAGDPAAVSDIVNGFQPLIRRVLRTYRHLPFWEDLPGEIYLIVADLVRDFDPERGIPFPHYLARMLPASVFTIVRRECRTARREVHPVSVDRDDTVAGSAAESASTSNRPPDSNHTNEVVDQVMLNDMIHRILKNLTPLQASVFALRALEGEDFRRIADQIGSSPGAARFVYHSARQRLQKQWPSLLSDAN